MNCQDITELLDNGDLRKLDAGERASVQQHLGACPECAREWRLFADFSALPDVLATEAWQTQCLNSVAQSNRGTRPAWRAPVVLGAFVCVAAAAAIYLRDAMDSRMGPPAVAASLSSTTAEPDLPLSLVGASSAAAVVAEAVEARPAEPAQLTGTSEVSDITVSLLPLRDIPMDATAREAMETFQGAVATALNDIAGVRSTSAVSLESAKRAGHAFVVDTRANRSGGSGSLRVTLRMIGTGPDGIVQPFAGEFTPDCVNGGDTAVGQCHDATTLARAFVETMKSHHFPTDTVTLRRLEAQLGDTQRDPAERLQTLQELARARLSPGDSSQPGGVRGALSSQAAVDGALALAAAGSAAQRAAVWRTLRGSRHPDLIEPLIASARYDADPATRRDAVVTLLADFSQEPLVRAALESVSREDAAPLVRGLAARAVHGEEHWQAYIVQSLQDEQRSAQERIEALLFHTSRPLQPGDRGEAALASLLGEAGAAALGGVLKEALLSSQGGEVRMFLVSHLGGVHHPSITEALLATVDQEAQEANWFQRRMILTQLTRRTADPKVREKLEQLAISDPDEEGRELARAALTPRSDTP